MEPAISLFGYEHLPERLQTVSKPFFDLAMSIYGAYPHGSVERGVCLRKLLEAKDAAVRCEVFAMKFEARMKPERPDDGDEDTRL